VRTAVIGGATHMPGNEQSDRIHSGAAESYPDFAPGFVHFTEDVVFGDLWTRPELELKLRSLLTLACLTTLGAPREHLTFHINLARKNGVSDEELGEAFPHLCFYAGWSRATAALTVAREILLGDDA